MNCVFCNAELDPVAFCADTYGCVTCRETFHVTLPPKPTITGGRQDISLREGKVFDAERLAMSPLFERKLF